LPRIERPQCELGAFVDTVALASRQRDARTRGAVAFDVAVFAPSGRCELVFVAPRGAAGFASFRDLIRSASLRASVPQLTATVPSDVLTDAAVTRTIEGAFDP
jgi:hypothetical protein